MEANRLNLSINGSGQKRPQQNPVHLENLIEWIGQLSHPQSIKDKLIARAKKYPDSALPHFKANITQHLQNVAKSSK